MHISELDTPAVVVDLDVMERNLARMALYCRERGLSLRPHAKTHKIPELAQRQIESGAIGITVAKLGEAEVMVEAGVRDVLIAYPIAHPSKAHRLARLAERARIAVALDSEEALRTVADEVRGKGKKLGVLVEIDVGLRRCGVANEQEALTLARRISEPEGLEFRGLMFYPGHLMVEAKDRTDLLAQVNPRLDRILETFGAAGIPLAVVSGGSTPTAFQSHLFHGVTEIRPGTYIFNDRNTLELGDVLLTDCALSVIVSVVSTAVRGRAIVDGGSKTYSSDRLLTGERCGFGLIKEDPEAIFETMSEEHGHLDISHSTRGYRVGDRLTILPNHVCATINMHDEIYGIRGQEVETVWRVAARGKVR